jgi:hypothetical protein
VSSLNLFVVGVIVVVISFHLFRFLEQNGHRILMQWLSDFSVAKNHAFLLDTLTVLGHLPFNNDHVSQNDMDELQMKIAELASAESGNAKGQCFMILRQTKRIIEARKKQKFRTS